MNKVKTRENYARKAKSTTSAMSSADVKRLRSVPRSVCSKCGSKRSYMNPMAKCWTCGKKFCFDHITVVTGKKSTEDYCDKCLKSK